LIEDKEACGASYDDAETLAAYRGFVPHTVEHNDFIKDAME
jgi:hypothetical protein